MANVLARMLTDVGPDRPGTTPARLHAIEAGIAAASARQSERLTLLHREMQRCWERLDQQDARTRLALAKRDGTAAQQMDTLAGLLERLEVTLAAGPGERRLLGIEAGLTELEHRLDRLATRLEEVIGFIAPRLDQVRHAQATYLGDATALTRLIDGHRILVDTRNVDIGPHLISLGQWEPDYVNVFRTLIRPGDTVFDLGANHGVYALVAAAATGPTGRVHAFEANPRLARLAESSLRLNGYGGIATLHTLAVGDRDGHARLVFDAAWSGGGSLFRAEGVVAGDEAVTCRLVALDTLFPDPALRIDVMKMDIEGAEGLALRGMRGLLERSPGVRIMLEYAPQMLLGSGCPPAEVTGMLEGLGLSAWSIEAEGKLVSIGWDDLRALPDGVRNILVARDLPG